MLRFTQMPRCDDGRHHVDHDDDHRDDEQDDDDEDVELRCHWQKIRRQSRRRSALREITPMSCKQNHNHCHCQVSTTFEVVS